MKSVEKNGAKRTQAAALTYFRDIKPAKLDWLWPNRVPLGKLTLLVGNPGVGKSFLTIYMAAQVSTGRAWADTLEPAPKGSVLILTAEDDLNDTVRIRLDAAGADLGKVAVLQAHTTMELLSTGQSASRVEEVYNLTDDLHLLQEAARMMPDLKMIVIDPISAYMGGKDSNSNSEVREFLRPLSDIARELKISVVGVSHLNKNQDMAVQYRTLGSIGFTAAVRASWLVVEDEKDPDRKLFVQAKQNLSTRTDGLAYRLMSQQVETEFGPMNGAYCSFEDEPVRMTAADLVGPSKKSNGRPKKQDGATEWLLAYLADGPKPASQVYEDAAGAGFSEKTMNRVKTKENIQAVRSVGEGGEILGWEWALPT